MAVDPKAAELSKIELLLDESRNRRYTDSRKMVELAELARAAAERLEAERWAEDVRARVWAELGNAYRVADRLDLAARAIARALRHYESGTLDRSVLVLITDRTASLLAHQRRFSEALDLLERLARFHRTVGDDHQAGRALITSGLYTWNGGDPVRGVLLTSAGLDLIDLGRERGLVLAAVHNLLCCAVDLGRFALARRLLPLVRPLYEMDSARANLLRLRWLEGRVAEGLGEPEEAEMALREARDGFLDSGLLFPASLVSLDLAQLWSGQGRYREIGEVAGELVASFQALRVGREAIVSLLLLRRACEGEAVSQDVREAIERTAGFLRDIAYERSLA